ncbi:MAG: hypothetical protein JSR71_13990 [Proteobacteria bacterium]|nr:hypothetical protein [Pseudomonadota bacterium]
MKKHFGMFITLCFVIVGGCFAAEVTKQNLRILSPVVQDALLRVENTLSSKRNPLEFTSGDIATTCNDYFRLKQKYEVRESVNNTRVAQDYILCDTLRILTASKESAFADSGISSPGDALANNLLVDSYSSSLYQKTDTHQNSLGVLLMSMEMARKIG